MTIAADPRHLGARLGFLAVLHTWGQNLAIHPHIHCVVPGGGLSRDAQRWIDCRPGFLLPVRVLSRFHRGRFLRLLQQARRRGRLDFHGQLAPLARPLPWKSLLRTLRGAEWVVYSKPPFGGPPQVLKYLARYTHRVAISNRRLIRFQDGRVTFRCRDRRGRRPRPRTVTLDGVEFLRRFLMHVLPKGFVRIRSYGFLANCRRKHNLALCRGLLQEPTDRFDSSENKSTAVDAALGDPNPFCPLCREGRMLRLQSPLARRIEERINSP